MVDDERTGCALPRGATGFLRPGDGALPDTDVRGFRTALYEAARVAGGRVGEVEERTYPLTFHTASVIDRAGEHVVLCHAHLPWVAFGRDRRNWYDEEFLDPPAWASAFTHVGFTVLDRERLATPLTDVDTSGFTRDEWRAVRLYRVTTLGGVLFNTWA
ncbi:hypothetical protein ACF068_12345 [Streptomyces sp. NPDC016309]|uniref:hypothetical protein n=1 Tax=Streptomyces sp. NPDC016309 TaxID=3364965 RepID=UPI0036FEA62A